MMAKGACCPAHGFSDLLGKGLLSLGMAAVLILYGFKLIEFYPMVQVIGLLFALKGIVQIKKSRCCTC